MTSIPTAQLYPNPSTGEGAAQGENLTPPTSAATPATKGRKRSTTAKRAISKRAVSEYFSAMETAVKENDVEKAVESATTQMLRSGLAALYPDSTVEITYPHGTDGLITVKAPEGSLFSAGETGEIAVLLEAKKQMQFSQSRGASDRAKVVAQAIYYLKRFQAAGELIPQVVVISDQDEIFYILSKFLTGYLDEDHDWSLAPSMAGERNFTLYQELLSDNNLNVYVEDINRRTFDVQNFLQRVNEGATQAGSVRKIKVDAHSLEKAWQEYQHRAFGGIIEDALLQVSVFVKFLLGDRNIYLHPTEKNTIVMEHVDHKGRTQWKKFPMKGSQFFSTMAHEQFFEKYDRAEYTWGEKKAITEIADTLIEEVKRRYHGDYWTPAIWVDEAHALITEQLGDDWREKYVVWDPAAGSKNLTRDYRFKELYSSTLHQEELAIAEEYNEEGTAFQYDFLNDDIALHDAGRGLFSKRPGEMSDVEKQAFLEEQRGKWKLPDGLIEALVYNKPIVFLMNPPYGSNGNRGEGERKPGIALTKTNKLMVQDGFAGHAAQELYTQFIYRCQQLALVFGYAEKFNVFLFAANTYLTSPQFARFGANLRAHYKHMGGFMLNAGEFKGTSSSWGINFTGWSLYRQGTEAMIPFSIRESTIGENGDPIVKEIATWNAIAVEKANTISTLIPSSQGDTLSKGSYPTTKNGFSTTKGQARGAMTHNAFGYFHNLGNTVHFSEKYIGFYSICFNHGDGIPVDEDNFLASTTVFSVRKAIYDRIAGEKLLWVRGKDNFPAPSQEFQDSDEWIPFMDDCLVYSLFASGSNQTSLRDYEYGVEADGITPKKWRINNEFYWESREFIRELAIENKMPAIEKDLATDSERYVYSYLKPKRESGELSFEAETLLSKATEILTASFKYRGAFYAEAPLYNTLSWDMGWLQVQRMCVGRDALSFAKADDELQGLYAEFKALRSALGEKIAARYSEDTGF